jgi:hypothetical protein
MDALLGGILMGLTLALAAIYWQLLVRPEVLLSLWQDVPQDGWFEEQHPAGLRALRWVTGATLVLLGFLTGLAWTFLVSTG